MHVVYKMWIALVPLVLISVGCGEQHGVGQDASLSDSSVELDGQAADSGRDAAGAICTSSDDCQAVQVASGLFHSCALMRSGRVACWGSNGHGELGRADLERSSVPLTVEGVPPATSIMVGPSYGCALSLEHQLWCWGGGLLDVSPTPSTDWLAAGSNAIAVDKFCYLAADGRVFCWGGAPGGRPVSWLGTGTTDPLAQPTIPVVGLTDAVELASGGSHVCVRTRSGVMWCWGAIGLSDPAGGFATPALTPVQVLEGVQQISAVAGCTCALLAPMDLRCWGWNSYGQIGVGSTDEWVHSPTAVLLPAGAEVTRVSAALDHACAVEGDGHVLCWGRNDHGQLGVAGTADSNVPVQVQDLDDAIFVSVETDYSCAVRASGEVWCWGATPSGQLSDRPVQVEGLR